jgi:hypothetical protein
MSLAHQIAPNGIAARALAAAGTPIDAIRVDGGTQSRAGVNQAVVEEYAAAIVAGATFPPVVVFYDGTDYWMADGFHRFHAYRVAKADRIAADVRQGTRRDAILYSVGANETHGLRRTNEDKHRAVLTLLNDAEWAKWSDREIGRACKVDGKTVAKIRETLTAEIRSDERTYTTKHGTTATMNTSAIGKTNSEQPKEEDQETVDAAVATRAASSQRKNGVAMIIPQGADVVDLCKRGLALEENGATAEKAATEIGIAIGAYRACRQIVLLAESPVLSAKDAALARQALDILVTTLQWGAAWEIAEPLAVRMWGEGTKYDLPNIAGKRLEKFERSFGIVLQGCMTTGEIDLPYLSPEDAKSAIRRIGQARGALARFAERIKDIHE